MTALKALPLEKLRQRLHVSVSQVNTYLMCPENYGESGVMCSWDGISCWRAGVVCCKVT